MKMANHPRPGDIIQESLDELNVSLREFARAMEIAPSTASRLLTGKAALTPEMAIKLSVVIGSRCATLMRPTRSLQSIGFERFVGRIRRSRRIRHEQSARCLQ